MIRSISMRSILFFAFAMTLLWSCGVYSPYGAQTSGAKSFSVDYFKPQTPLASPELAQNFTEALKDLILRQSTLSLEEREGELQFSGMITSYTITPVSVQDGETASVNRLTVGVKVKYVNTLDKNLNFDKTFSKFTDYDASEDLFGIETELMEDLNDQLTQEIFNASLGNW
ncbi:MAG: LptE family protein [Flavobacteriales bacterium]